MSLDRPGRRPAAGARRAVAIIVVGNEVLSGKVAEQNAAYFIRRLRELGARVREVVIVEDDVQAIARAVRRLRPEVDDVVTSGGVGPTHDDVTIEAVALALGVPVVESPAIAERLEAIVRAPLTPGHRRLCKIPDGSELVFGTKVPWPIARIAGGASEADLWLFPGVPPLLQALFEDVRQHFAGSPPFHHAALELVAEESMICEALDGIVLAHPAVAIGSYPRREDGGWRLRLTFEGDAEDAVRAALAEAERCFASYRSQP